MTSRIQPLFRWSPAVALLAVFACSDNPAGLTPPTEPSAAIGVNDPRGELIVEIRYEGAFYDASAPEADNDCQLLVDVNVPTWSGNAVRYCERTRTTIISPNTYSSRPWIYDGYAYPTLVQNIPVTVTAGQTTTQIYELSDMTGIVAGTVLVDGQSASSSYRVCLTTGGCSNFPSGDGSFRLITKPGEGQGVIWNNIGGELGRFTYTAQLGATVVVADQAVADPRSTLTVEVRYDGQFYDGTAPTADNDCQLLVDVSVPPWSGNAVRYCERTRTTVVVPGTYSSRPWIYDGFQYPTLVQNIPITLANGETRTQVYELSEMTGIVAGTVLVDGQPATSSYQVCLTTGGCTNFRRADGSFKLITGPGEGAGVIRNNTGTELARFTYTAVLGQTVTVEQQAVTDPRGQLTVELRYQGQLYDPNSPAADNDCQLLVDVGVQPWSGNAVRYCERTRSTVVVPGTYSSRPWIYDGFAYPTLVQNIPVTVTAGQTTTQVYELSDMTGIVTGTVLVDGQPAGSSYRVCLTTGGCSNFPSGDGSFRLITKPGQGEGVIWNNIGVELGRFTYGVEAGEETPMGTIGSNQPPVAHAGGPYAGSEGAAIAFDGTASSDPDGDELSYDWDFNGDNVVDATGAQPSHTFADDGVYTIRLTVSDGNGESDTQSATVTVANVAPSVQIDSGAEILQGEPYANPGSFADPGADTWTAVVAFGDATGEQPLALTGMEFELSHTYQAAGTFAARATVTDDDGGSGSAEASVVVLSPQQAARRLLERVAQLAEVGVLNRGEAQALSAKLNAAIGQMDRGRVSSAGGQIGAFQNQVSAMVAAGRLPSSMGQALIDYAERIIRSAQSSL